MDSPIPGGSAQEKAPKLRNEPPELRRADVLILSPGQIIEASPALPREGHAQPGGVRGSVLPRRPP